MRGVEKGSGGGGVGKVSGSGLVRECSWEGGGGLMIERLGRNG